MYKYFIIKTSYKVKQHQGVSLVLGSFNRPVNGAAYLLALLYLAAFPTKWKSSINGNGSMLY